ncbi:MAG TPA: hypothetical protein VGH87_07075, partial [Polyangiaceae bacterium]
MLAALPLYACAGSTAIEDDAGPTQDGGTAQAMTGAQLRSNVRDGFVAEAEWMRTYGVATLDKAPDAQAAFDRLSQTEAQIVQQVAAVAGDDRAAQLGVLLHTRATLFSELVAATGSNAAPLTDDPQVALDANAAQIA